MPEPYHSLVMMLLVLGFAYVSFALFSRLRDHHATTWRELGEPQVWRFASNSRLKTAQFVYLSGQHRKLGDPVLTRYVYSMRAIFVLFATGAILKMAGWTLF